MWKTTGKQLTCERVCNPAILCLLVSQHLHQYFHWLLCLPPRRSQGPGPSSPVSLPLLCRQVTGKGPSQEGPLLAIEPMGVQDLHALTRALVTEENWIWVSSGWAEPWGFLQLKVIPSHTFYHTSTSWGQVALVDPRPHHLSV